jgi:hypothetical protein
VFEFDPPRSTESLLATLESQSAEIDAYMDSFSTEDFLAPQGEAWSPAGHLRHLVKSVRAVTRGMAMPKLALRALFGTTSEGSRSFEEVRNVYLGALDRGGQAGRYAPSERVVDLDPEDWRELIMERWRESTWELAQAVRGWREAALDRYRLPHPLLGKMTVREILLFTLYHNRHHAARVLERATPAAGDPPATTAG